MNINKLFFELIQVSLGTRGCFSHMPSAEEWGELYNMAKKQSLVGVCFFGVQKLVAKQQELPEMLHLTWMGMAAKIQQRNEVLNKNCEKLYNQLSSDGFRTCIFKGQAIAKSYSDGLPLLRQSGDIDIWCVGETIHSLVRYLQSRNVRYEAISTHVGCSFLSDTEVELHPQPAVFRCLWNNLRLKRWFKSFDVDCFECSNGFLIPSIEFNLVYLMIHMYNHTLFEGIGLRQMVDYYFVLTQSNTSQKNDALRTLKSLGISKYISAVMYIMENVFDVEKNVLLCPSDARLGLFLLKEIMEGGNFGHHDKRFKHSNNLLVHGLIGMQKKIKMWEFAPFEILFSPFWSLWQISWRISRGYMKDR